MAEPNRNVLAYHVAYAQARGMRIRLVRTQARPAEGVVVRTTIDPARAAAYARLRRKTNAPSTLLIELDSQEEPIPLDTVTKIERA